MNLDSMTSAQLVETYNAAATTLGENTVKKFSDKTTALRRTRKAVKLAKEKAGATTKLKPARKKRGVYFKLPYNGDEQFRAVRSETSLRGRCITLLKTGGTFADVIELVNKFDVDTERTTGNVERRAYEIVRIMHYYLGYGIDHDQATGVIKLHKRAVKG